jgi:uncharacterized protein YjbI with pentapeptide repeats
MKAILIKLVYTLLPIAGTVLAIIALISREGEHLRWAWYVIGFAIFALIVRALLLLRKRMKTSRAIVKLENYHQIQIQEMWKGSFTSVEVDRIAKDFDATAPKIDSAKAAIQRWNLEIGGNFVIAVLIAVLPIVAWIRYQAFSSTCVRNAGPESNLVECDFNGRDLSGMDINGADLSGATLQDADLSEADLTGANLTEADLRGADLTRTVLTGVILDCASLEGTAGLSDQDLREILAVSAEELPSTLSRKEIRLDSRDAILQALQETCQGDGVTEAADYVSDESFHPLALISITGEKHELSHRIPDSWEPMALRFAELVACAEDEHEVAIEQCSYAGGPAIKRLQYQMHMQVMAAKTGEMIVERTFKGTEPRSCPIVAPATQTTIKGDPIEFEEVESFLETYIHPAAP